MSTLQPLVYEFTVACSPDHAFTTWTTRMNGWWPKNHSTSGDPDMQVEMQGEVGGAIRERTSAGEVIEWGRVTRWEPPHVVAYTWFVGSAEADATDVEVTFTEADGTTLVRLVHRGWDRRADGEEWRERNGRGWSDVLPRFTEEVGQP
ncbi:MAG: SRPBCC domain-containing protein [Actinomycetota bacterium]